LSVEWQNFGFKMRVVLGFTCAFKLSLWGKQATLKEALIIRFA